jgi:hypothetical protein
MGILYPGLRIKSTGIPGIPDFIPGFVPDFVDFPVGNLGETGDSGWIGLDFILSPRYNTIMIKEGNERTTTPTQTKGGAMFTQLTFSGVNKFFSWTTESDGSTWYEWDYDGARKWALKERNRVFKDSVARGHQATKFSLGTQTLTKGGIGSGLPEITIEAKVYGVNFTQAA